MKCDEVGTWMLNDESPQRPSAEIREHLRICDGCRRTYRSLVRILQVVATEPLPPIPVGARERLLASLPEHGDESNGIVAYPVRPAEELRVGTEMTATPQPDVRRPTLRLLDAPKSAYRSAKERLRTARPSLRWAGAAAAALLLVSLGLGLSSWLKKTPVVDKTVPMTNASPHKQESDGLEERVLEIHLRLAETKNKQEFVALLMHLATEIQEATLAAARENNEADVAVLAWLHATVLHDGLARLAPDSGELTKDQQDSRRDYVTQTEKELTAAASRHPEAIGKHLLFMSRHANGLALTLKDGPPMPPPSLEFSRRPLLQILVPLTAQLPECQDNLNALHRAEKAIQVVEKMASHLEGLPQLDAHDGKRLTHIVHVVVEHAILVNFKRLDIDSLPNVKVQHLRELMKRAGKCGDRLAVHVERLPSAEDQEKLQATIKLARQFGQHPPSKKRPPAFFQVTPAARSVKIGSRSFSGFPDTFKP